jgi:hypothetical protein
MLAFETLVENHTGLQRVANSISPEWQRLLPRLRETAVKRSGHGYEHRTAVLLFGQDGRRVASVYFGQFGGDGTIDGDSGTITSGLYHWAKSLLKGVAE